MNITKNLLDICIFMSSKNIFEDFFLFEFYQIAAVASFLFYIFVILLINIHSQNGGAIWIELVSKKWFLTFDLFSTEWWIGFAKINKLYAGSIRI